MARHRVYGYPSYVSSARLSSQRSYSTIPARTPLTSGISRATSSSYDTSVEDYLLSDRVSQVSYLSNALLDEGYDMSRRSRGRDQQLLKDATNAIVSSESYATPQTSVAARRVARRVLAPRAASVPPRPVAKAYPEVDSRLVKPTTFDTDVYRYVESRRPIIIISPSKILDRAWSVPPESLIQRTPFSRVQALGDWRARVWRGPPVVRPRRIRRAVSVPPPSETPEVLPTAGLRAHRVPRRYLLRGPDRVYIRTLLGYYEHPILTRQLAYREARLRGDKRPLWRNRVIASPKARVTAPSGYYRWRYVAGPWGYTLLPRHLPSAKPISARESLSNFPQVYVPVKGPKPSNRAKAAIIASKLEPDPLKRRSPRSKYAADKLREMRKEAQESVYSAAPSTTGLYASKPPLPKISEGKAFRTEDGFSKPKNILSWQYRLDSRLSPNDLLYQPSSFIRIREQVRDAQERLDRHRQLLDRYLPEGGESGDVAASILRKMNEMERRDGLASRRPKNVEAA